MVMSETAQKRLTFFAFLPLLLAPVLSIELSRLVAFLPLISAFLFLPLLSKSSWGTLPKFKHIALYVALFFILMSLHSYFIAGYEEAYERLSKLFLIFTGGGFFLFVLKSTDIKDTPCYTKLLLYGSAIAASFLSLELMLGEPIYRFFHEIENDDYFSTAVYNRGAVVITTLFLLSFFLSVNKEKRTTLITMLPVIAMLVLAQSQSAQLLFVFALIFYFLFPFQKRIFWISLSIILVALMFTKPFLSLYFFENLPAFLDEIYIFKHGYAGPRLEIWDYVSRKILESPLWGHGLEFTRIYDNFQNQEKYTTTQSVLHPHSSVLQIWIEFGLVGVVFAASSFVALTSYIYKNLNSNVQKSALTMFISLIFVSSFSHGFWQSWWLGLIFMTAGWVVLNNKAEQTP